MFRVTLFPALVGALLLGTATAAIPNVEISEQPNAALLLALNDDPQICSAERRTSRLARQVSTDCRLIVGRFVWKKACNGRSCPDPYTRECYGHLNDHEYQGLLTFINDCNCTHVCPADY